MPIVIARPFIQTYSNIILNDNPLGYFRLNEPSGVVAADSSGNGFDGTWSGTPTLGVTGLVSGSGDLAATLDGSSSFVQIDTNDFNATFGDFAIEMWVDTSQSSGNIVFWDKRDNANLAQGYLVGMVNGNAYLFTKSSGPEVQLTVTGSVNIADGSKHHVVFNFDRSGGPTGEIWVDGTLDNSGAITGSGTSISSGATLARIGYRSYTVSSFTYFQGTMDEVVFYSGSTLSPTQIATRYNFGA